MLILSTPCLGHAPVFASELPSFPDVQPTDWFCENVSYAYCDGIVRGDNGKFRPNDPVTRAEFVTMLARLLLSEQYPEDLSEMQFEDVPEDSYYEKAVRWASVNEITNGTTDTMFSPDSYILRQDMATMIYRAEALPELGELPAVAEAAAFQDEADISDYAVDALTLLQVQGLMKGNPDGTVKPQSNLTRAEAVTVLTRIQLYLTNHSHSYSKAETTASTCTTMGLQYYRCACGSYYAKAEIPKADHSYVKAELVSPTCTAEGTRYYRCSCGSYYTAKEGAALGHSYQSSVNYSTWTRVYTCSRCGTHYSELLPPQKFYDGSKMMTHAEILTTINKLQTMYPGLVSSYSGGKSVNGADLRVVKLGKGSRYIFMNGNLHGNEAITTNYLLKVLDEYAYAYATNGSIGGCKIKPLLDKFTIVMIPCSNPDGRAKLLKNLPYIGDSRTNGRGVNLNANFPTNWEWTSESGSCAASEPETKAIINVMSSYKFEVVLDCHNSGNCIYYADYQCSEALTNRSAALAKAIKAISGYGMGKYNATPGLANYARHPYGVPGLTVEMCPGVDTGHNCAQFPTLWSQLSAMPVVVMNFLQ
ncbi:MAG: S-layer homology domain-containing protein [Oscillospiraceae bacterium]|nr:S-layer homology domain-containing protein [Oscillospiraceae bacterium]